MNRQERMAWAKARALEELDADPTGRGPLNAITSIQSDLRKHPETEDHNGILLTTMLAMNGTVGVTTGWRPAFLLVHRSSDYGSGDVLGAADHVTGVKRDRKYVAVECTDCGRPA